LRLFIAERVFDGFFGPRENDTRQYAYNGDYGEELYECEGLVSRSHPYILHCFNRERAASRPLPQAAPESVPDLR